MDVLFSFLIEIIRSTLYCWRVVQPHEAAVRTTCGKRPRVLGPGLHFMFPVIGEMVVIPVVEQVQDIRSQSLTTSDGQQIAIGISIAYEVTDPLKAVFAVQDWDQSLSNEALRICGEYVLASTFEQCVNAETMCREIMRRLHDVATLRWGLVILRVGRSDFTRCRALRLMTESTTVKPSGGQT